MAQRISIAHSASFMAEDNTPSLQTQLDRAGTFPVVKRRRRPVTSRTDYAAHFSGVHSDQHALLPDPNNDETELQSVQTRQDDSGSISQQSNTTTSTQLDTIAYEPIEPPPDYHQLKCLPDLLDHKVTITLAVFYLLLAVATILLATLPRASIPYPVRSDSYYMLVQYGPGVLAAISIMFCKSVSQEFLHVLPYINMADVKGRKAAKHNILSGYWPVFYAWPNSLSTWLHYLMLSGSSVLIGYKALLLEVVSSGTSWQVYTHPHVAKPLFAYYVLMFIYMTSITIWLWNRTTGLRWIPETLADIACLFNCFDPPTGSNVSSESGIIPPVITEDMYKAEYRLGYWRRKSTDDNEDIVHGIRMISAASSSEVLNSWEERVRNAAEKHPSQPYLCSIVPVSRYWIFGLIILAGFVVFPMLAISGYIRHNFVITKDFTVHRFDHFAANITSQVDSGNITLEVHGLAVYVDSSTIDSDARRTGRLLLANFIFRTIPLILVAQVPFGFAEFDPLYRLMQPLYNMTKKPCMAVESVLMAYISKSPFTVITNAFARGYWKVFLFCVLGSIPEFLMLLPYGVLGLVSIGDFIVAQFSIPALITTCVLFLIYLIMLITTWPRRSRMLPRPRMTIMDIWVLFRGSQLVNNPAFKKCHPGWTREVMQADLQRQHNEYVLGLRQDTADRQCLGFDIYSTAVEQSSHFEQQPTERVKLVEVESISRVCIPWSWFKKEAEKIDVKED